MGSAEFEFGFSVACLKTIWLVGIQAMSFCGKFVAFFPLHFWGGLVKVKKQSKKLLKTNDAICRVDFMKLKIQYIIYNENL